VIAEALAEKLHWLADPERAQELAEAVLAAVRDAEARVRDHYHTTGRALREIGDVLRNGTLTDSRKVSAIAAVMANGPLDDAPGGPCEDAAFAARREAFREAVEALRGESDVSRSVGADLCAEDFEEAADLIEQRFGSEGRTDDHTT